jgi:hypothetical protein
MLLLVVIVGVAGLVAGCLYARERRRRLTAEAHVEGCRLAARVAIRDRDAAVAERDEWAKHAGEARGDAENARRDLATARQDFEIRGRSQGEAVAVGQRREREAADLLRDALTLLSP